MSFFPSRFLESISRFPELPFLLPRFLLSHWDDMRSFSLRRRMCLLRETRNQCTRMCMFVRCKKQGGYTLSKALFSSEEELVHRND